jgi:hypothetical protein
MDSAVATLGYLTNSLSQAADGSGFWVAQITEMLRKAMAPMG